VLSLESTKLGNGRVRILSSGLGVNETLRELNIGANPAFTNWRAFSAALASPRSRLEKLDLSRNTMCDLAVLSITNALLINTTIKSLILNSTWDISIAGTNHLYQMLESPSCSLKILNLNHNGLDDELIQSLANALANNGLLRKLNLSNNWQITNVGWETFAAVLRNPNSSLEKLDLSPIEISDQAMMFFAGSLTNNITLTDLILDHDPDEQGRHIKPVGCAAFIRMLCGDSSILSTYHSNHTLERLCCAHREDSLPEDLLSLLQINRDNNLSQAARMKILMLSGEDLAPFFLCMKINALPYAIAWMARDDNSEIDDRSLNGMSLMFLLFHTMPTLFKRGL
jgi:hypothetical protein